MRQHTQVFDAVRRRPGMYFQSPSYDCVAAFVQGYDAACDGRLLLGFREWLVRQLGYGANLAWPALVLLVTFGSSSIPRDEADDAAGELAAIDSLFDLIERFDAVRRDPDGLR